MAIAGFCGAFCLGTLNLTLIFLVLVNTPFFNTTCPVNTSPENTAKLVFWATWCLTLGLKLWLATFFPITGDEAFFNVWSWFPQWGYYDHPPMVGWWLWVMKQFGNAPWVLRIPTVLLSSAIALLIVRWVRGGSLGWWAGTLYLSLPVSWFGVFITTDTPLIYFLTAALYTYVRAWQMTTAWSSLWRIAMAGTWLGLAFLSKYFAVLMGLAFIVHLVFQRRWLWLWIGLLAALPWVGINVYDNAHNCWNNVMFNVFNRHDDATFNARTPWLYLATLAYVLSPWVLWHLFKLWRLALPGKAQNEGWPS